jgi:hypothetical protein
MAVLPRPLADNPTYRPEHAAGEGPNSCPNLLLPSGPVHATAEVPNSFPDVLQATPLTGPERVALLS